MVDTPAKALRAISADSPIRLSIVQAGSAILSLAIIGFSAGGLYYKFDALQEDIKKQKVEDAEWKKGVAADIENLKQQMFLLQVAAATPGSGKPGTGFPRIGTVGP